MNQKRLLSINIFMLILVTIVLWLLNINLRTPITPLGIVSFEFIGSSNQAVKALRAWGETGRIVAGISLGLDFLYIVLYVLVLCSLVNMVVQRIERENHRKAKKMVALYTIAIAAGLLDVVENVALIYLLLEYANTIGPAVAYISAALKFGLIFFLVAVLVVLFFKYTQSCEPADATD